MRTKGLELDGGPALHEKVVKLLQENAQGWGPKDEKAEKKIKRFVLRTILRELAKQPKVFFRWLAQDRKAQRARGANRLRQKLSTLILKEEFIP